MSIRCIVRSFHRKSSSFFFCAQRSRYRRTATLCPTRCAHRHRRRRLVRLCLSLSLSFNDEPFFMFCFGINRRLLTSPFQRTHARTHAAMVDGGNTGAIAGGVIGALIALAALAVGGSVVVVVDLAVRCSIDRCRIAVLFYVSKGFFLRKWWLGRCETFFFQRKLLNKHHAIRSTQRRRDATTMRQQELSSMHSTASVPPPITSAYQEIPPGSFFVLCRNERYCESSLLLIGLLLLSCGFVLQSGGSINGLRSTLSNLAFQFQFAVGIKGGSVKSYVGLTGVFVS